jgi:hypothetical protein
MRKFAVVLFLAMALLLAPVAPSNAQSHGGGHGGGGYPSGAHPSGGYHGGGYHGDGHGGGWHGSGWYGGIFVGAPWWYPYSYGYPYPYPYGYYPSPYYAYPPPVLEDPSVYIERELAPSAEPAPSAAPPQTYWYYCASAKAYYPSVQKCREAWIKVPPPPE